MKYAIDGYLKAKEKWGTINSLLSEINEIIHGREKSIEGTEKLFRELIRDISSRKKAVKGLYWQHNQPFYIFNGGFGFMPTYRHKLMALNTDNELFAFLMKNREQILKTIPNKHKKAILSVFLNTWKKHKLDFKPIKTAFTVNKKVVYVSHSGYVSDKQDSPHTIIVKSVFTELRDDSIKIGLTVQKKPKNSDDHEIYDEDEGINENDFKQNMIKEQLYLPLWKLLIKAKRRAKKELRKVEKMSGEIREQLNPYLVAQEI
jgi:hypothetical protein